MGTSIVESCGALIYCTSTKRYLFLLRNGPGKYNGTWGLVGGKIETNETIIDALNREILEELSGTIKGIELHPVERFVSPNKKFIYHTFLTTVEEEFVPILNDEHRGYCWVELKDHPKPLHPGVWRTFAYESMKNKISIIEKIINSPSQLQTQNHEN